MKTVRLPKFDWNKIDERNSGHTKNEWGMQDEKKESNIRVIEAYTVSWDLEKSTMVSDHLKKSNS